MSLADALADKKATTYGTEATHVVPAATTPAPAATAAAAPSSKFACLKYGLFLLTGFLICLALRNDGVQFLSRLPGLSAGCSSDRCYCTQAVFRVSFSLLLFYLMVNEYWPPRVGCLNWRVPNRRDVQSIAARVSQSSSP